MGQRYLSSGLARQGWVPKTLTPGMKVKTVIHPLRDGTAGGQFMAITLPDGTEMGNPNGRPNANAGAPASTAPARQAFTIQRDIDIPGPFAARDIRQIGYECGPFNESPGGTFVWPAPTKEVAFDNPEALFIVCVQIISP